MSNDRQKGHWLRRDLLLGLALALILCLPLVKVG
jgi:hypothetical protein